MPRYSLAAVPCVLMLACATAPRAAPPASERVPPSVSEPLRPRASTPKPRTLTVLVTTATPGDYCNGEKMDSDGYRKTLTREKSLELPPEGASDTEVVRAVVAAATQGMCQTVMSQLDYRNEGGTLHIPPFDAWAGVSITMCHCQPEVEVNFSRIPGVTRVVWDGA